VAEGRRRGLWSYVLHENSSVEDQPVKLKERLRTSAATVNPAQPSKSEPAQDPVAQLSRVPPGIQGELSPADQAGAAELRTRQRRGLLRQHALSREDKPKRERFLTWADLFERRLIRSKTQGRRLWEAGKMPRPVHLSERVIAFRESEIEAWAASRQYEPSFGAFGKRLSPEQAARKRTQV
jgi:predicted DNA-binding transcriptional regulator AlpA